VRRLHEKLFPSDSAAVLDGRPTAPRGSPLCVRAVHVPVPAPPLKSNGFTSCRRKAPTGRHANPTLVGGSDEEAASTDRCGQERLLCGGPSRGRAMTENSNSNDDNGANRAAMTDYLFGWPGDGVHWAWQRCGRYQYQKVLVHSTNPPPGSPRGVADECPAPADRRPVRGWA
jgi:hypothetical protein